MKGQIMNVIRVVLYVMVLVILIHGVIIMCSGCETETTTVLTEGIIKSVDYESGTRGGILDGDAPPKITIIMENGQVFILKAEIESCSFIPGKRYQIRSISKMSKAFKQIELILLGE